MPEDDFDLYGEDEGFHVQREAEVGGIRCSEMDLYLLTTSLLRL